MNEKAWVACDHYVQHSFIALLIADIVLPCRKRDRDSVRGEGGYRRAERELLAAHGSGSGSGGCSHDRRRVVVRQLTALEL